MDNITHAALGLAITQTPLGAKLGTAGVALALLASELPDVDIFFGMGNPWSMITLHRGITHSILLAPLAAAALAGLWTLFSRGSFWAYLLLALVCLLGHIGLDVLTTYGTQMLEPLSNRRFGLGWVAVVDPVVTVVLLGGAIAAWWLRTGHPVTAPRWATGALIITGGYFLLGAWMHHRAMLATVRHASHLGPAIAADATPQLGTIFLWRLLYRSEHSFWVGRYNSFSGEISGQTTLASSVEPALTPLLASPPATTFRWFAGQLVRPHIDPADANTLILEDMRFSFPTDAPVGLWALRMTFERNGSAPEVRQVQFVQRRLRFSDGPPRERLTIVPAMIE